ncbi:unnamed protein product [Brassica oleracea var. botrytis]
MLSRQQDTLFLTKKLDQEPCQDIIFRSKLADIVIPNHLPLTDYVFQRFSGNGDGDSTATCLIDSATGRIFTYANVQINSQRVAVGIHRLGIRQRDTVMLLLPNSPEFAFSFLAVAYLGAVTTTANPLYTQAEIARQANASATKMIITKQCYRIHLVFNLFSVRFGSDSFGFGSVRIVNVGTRKYPEKVRFSFGSGSGSDSSGMMLYVYIINIFIYSGTRSVLGSVPVRFGYFGYKNIGTVWVFEGISPVLVMELIQRYKVTVVPVAPSVVLAFVKSQETERYDLSSVRMMISGAATLRKELEEAVLPKFPNAIFGQVRLGYFLYKLSSSLSRKFSYFLYKLKCKK